MNTNFKSGDKVRFLHEKGEGVVSRNTDEFLHIVTDEGFEITRFHNEVIIIPENSEKKADEHNNTNIFSRGSDADNSKNKNVSDKQEPNKQTKKLSLGIYLAFSPVNQNVLTAGDLHVYLINYTKLDAFYLLFLNTTEVTKPQYKGFIDSASAELIDTVKRQDLHEFANCFFQCLFTNTVNRNIPEPVHTQFEIRFHQFLKNNQFKYNTLISLNAFTIQLLCFDNVKWCLKPNNTKTVYLPDNAHKISEDTDKEALINNYQIADREAEIDLHFEKISKTQTNDDSVKLLKQINFLKKTLQSAIENNYRRVVYIHGVGAGVLKIEIHKILRSYENVGFRDAPVSKYGIGATEVIIEDK